MPTVAHVIAAVHRLPSVTFSVFTKLVTNRMFDIPLHEWTRDRLIALGIENQRANVVLHELRSINLAETSTLLQQHAIHLVTINDPAYPAQLKEIASPPPVLYVRGSIASLSRAMLGVVGTRRATSYGLHVTSMLLEPIVKSGLVIVSGLALGIDGRAHQLAVDHHAPTIAVLGCGVDTIYPWEHRKLAERIIASGGAIISEFPLGAQPERHHFPQRNRIISGLSRAVLLVEAGEKSGALITAKFAVEQNRDVLVVPGNITSPESVGPLNWLKLGATPVTSATDILRVFDVTAEAAQPAASTYQPQSSTERIILENLASGERHIDELAETCRLDSSVVSATLSLLEINGAVRHRGGLVYTLH